jgi:hypothetical protein
VVAGQRDPSKVKLVAWVQGTVRNAALRIVAGGVRNDGWPARRPSRALSPAPSGGASRNGRGVVWQ